MQNTLNPTKNNVYSKPQKPQWMVWLKWALLIVAGVLITDPAMASISFEPHGGNTWDFYAYGNAYAISHLFGAMVMIVQSGTFKTLCMGLALIGFMGSGAAGLISGQPAKFAGYVVGLVLVAVFVFSVQMKIHVKELVYTPGSSFAPQVVDHVPGAVGIPMVLISKVGKGISDMVEQAFTTPSGKLPSSSLPFGAGMSISRDVMQVRIRNPYLRKNFHAWAVACFMPRVYSGQINMASAANSPDLLKFIDGTIAATSPTQFFHMTYLNGRVDTPAPHESQHQKIEQFNGNVSCSEGWPYIKDQLQMAIGAQLTGNGGKLSAQLLRSAGMSSTLVTTIAENAIGGGLNDATALATQGAVIDLINGTSRYQAQALHDEPAMLALNINQAQRSQKSGWYTASVLFRDMGGYFYAILQCFLLGVAPLICALLFIPGMGGKLGGSYLKACVWLASWWPALQIVNYIMELYYQAGMDAYIGGGSAAGGLTMVNSGLVNQFNENMLIACGFMATLVPTIMWGIINGGGFALTTVLERAGGSTYASQAGEASAAGNFRAGNAGMNSFNANKVDTVLSNKSGVNPYEAEYGAGAAREDSKAGGANLAVDGQQQTRQLTQKQIHQITEARSQTQSSKESFTKDKKAAMSQLNTLTEGFLQNASQNSSGEVKIQSQHQRQKAQAIMDMYQEAKKHGYTNSRATELAGKLAAGLEGKIGFGLDSGAYVTGKAEASLSGSEGNKSTQGRENSHNTNKSTQHGDTDSGSKSHGSTDIASTGKQSQDSDVATVQHSLQTAYDSQKQYQEALSHQQSVQDSIQRSQSLNVTTAASMQDVNAATDAQAARQNADDNTKQDLENTDIAGPDKSIKGAVLSGQAQEAATTKEGIAEARKKAEAERQAAENDKNSKQTTAQDQNSAILSEHNRATAKATEAANKKALNRLIANAPNSSVKTDPELLGGLASDAMDKLANKANASDAGNANNGGVLGNFGGSGADTQTGEDGAKAGDRFKSGRADITVDTGDGTTVTYHAIGADHDKNIIYEAKDKNGEMQYYTVNDDGGFNHLESKDENGYRSFGAVAANTIRDTSQSQTSNNAPFDQPLYARSGNREYFNGS